MHENGGSRHLSRLAVEEGENIVISRAAMQRFGDWTRTGGALH